MLVTEANRGNLVFLLLPSVISSLMMVVWDFCNGMEKEEGCLYVILKLVVRIAVFISLLLVCLKLGEEGASKMSWASVFSPLWLVAAIIAIFGVFTVFHLFYKTILIFVNGKKELDDYKLAWWIFGNVIGTLVGLGGFLFRVAESADKGAPLEASLWLVLVCLVTAALLLVLTFFSYETIQ